MLDIKISKTDTPKPKPEGPVQGVGKLFTDHMFLMDYTEGTGWHDPRIVPYAKLSLDPSAMVFHYAQEMFEGMKAYKHPDGTAYLFRPAENARRLNRTAGRLCIPQTLEEDYLQAIRTLVTLEADWISSEPNASLYIRPFVIATEANLSIGASTSYLFVIILSPSGLFYMNDLTTIDIWVEGQHVRAVRGGVGDTKTGGNYAASLAIQRKAQSEGYTQVLWLDAIEHKYVEEVGSMNIFFKIDGKLITPALTGSLLPGITRDSVITLCRDWGYPVEERLISIDELCEAQKSGALEEIFGTGTAAVISPVGKLRVHDEDLIVADGNTGPLSKKLFDILSGIQRGTLEDKFGWRVTL